MEAQVGKLSAKLQAEARSLGRTFLFTAAGVFVAGVSGISAAIVSGHYDVAKSAALALVVAALSAGVHAVRVALARQKVPAA